LHPLSKRQHSLKRVLNFLSACDEKTDHHHISAGIMPRLSILLDQSRKNNFKRKGRTDKTLSAYGGREYAGAGL
jgi:hypothetical protein